MHAAGADYATTSVTVTIPATVSSQSVIVPIINDSLIEGVEQFSAQLSLPAGQDGVMLGANTATVEITGDDGEGLVQLVLY